jgi:hypothetical protein
MALDEPVVDQVDGCSTREHVKLAAWRRPANSALPRLLLRGAKGAAEEATEQFKSTLLQSEQGAPEGNRARLAIFQRLAEQHDHGRIDIDVKASSRYLQRELVCHRSQTRQVSHVHRRLRLLDQQPSRWAWQQSVCGDSKPFDKEIEAFRDLYGALC